MATWLLLVLCVGAADWATVIGPAKKQVPRLEALKEGAETPGICSAVVLNEAGYVLTAAHCIPVGEKGTFSLTINGRHADAVKVNRILDLAVLRFSRKDEIAMPLADDTPPMGTEIAVVGFMLGSKDFRTQFGHISARRDDAGGAIVIDGVALPGDSGGAIMDAAGRLVGMTNQYYRGSAVGLAVPVETVRDFAEDYLPKPKK